MNDISTFNEVNIKEIAKGIAYSSASINLSIRYIDEDEYVAMHPEEKSAIFDGCIAEAELIVNTIHESFDALNAGKIISLDISEKQDFTTTSFRFLIIKKERTIKLSNNQYRIFYTGLKFGEATHDGLGIFNTFVPKLYMIRNRQTSKIQLAKIYNEQQKNEFNEQYSRNETYDVISLNDYLSKMDSFSKTIKVIDLT